MDYIKDAARYAKCHEELRFGDIACSALRIGDSKLRSCGHLKLPNRFHRKLFYFYKKLCKEIYKFSYPKTMYISDDKKILIPKYGGGFL